MSTRYKNNTRYIHHNFLIDIYLSNTFNFLREKHENFENGATNLNLFSHNLSRSCTLCANAKIDARDCLRIINSGEICTEHFVIANFATRACALPRSIPRPLCYCFFFSTISFARHNIKTKLYFLI